MITEKPRYLGVFAFFEEVPEPRVERTNKRGIQAKRKLAAWDEAYLVKLLQAGLPVNPAD